MAGAQLELRTEEVAPEGGPTRIIVIEENTGVIAEFIVTTGINRERAVVAAFMQGYRMGSRHAVERLKQLDAQRERFLLEPLVIEEPT